jgi:hypothetical protein
MCVCVLTDERNASQQAFCTQPTDTDDNSTGKHKLMVNRFVMALIMRLRMPACVMLILVCLFVFLASVLDARHIDVLVGVLVFHLRLTVSVEFVGVLLATHKCSSIL